MKWLDEEFVWMDAVEIGGRIYHASCHAEARKSYQRGTGTPEPVLGKRKNEVSYPGCVGCCGERLTGLQEELLSMR